MSNSITIKDLEPLKKEYEKAVKGGIKVFLYKGTEILTSYARYLIEYMEKIKGNLK